MKSSHKTRPFRSAKEEIKERVAREKIEDRRSRAFRIAFSDDDFLLRKELRAVRLQLELLKPEIYLQDERIESTVVFFGSARIPDMNTGKKNLTVLKAKSAKHPENIELKKQVNIAEKILAKCVYYEEARKLASIISKNCQHEHERDFVVVTGGGPGIMEAANRGAADVRAKSIGLNIVLPLEQEPNIYITPELNFRFHYFAIRKMHFLIRARALIAFPGGFGTMDELFEALTLLQTRKIKPIPVLLFGKDYWSSLINFNGMVEEGTINQEDLMLFEYVETADEAWRIIADFYKIPIREENE